MSSMKFRSRSIRFAAGGFTLVEVLLAAAIALFVGGTLINTYLGASTTMNAAVGSSQIKQTGDQALDELFRRLKAVRKVFARGDAANSWLARTDLRPYLAAGLTPQVETTELVLPEFLPEANFSSGGSVAGSVGNALWMVCVEPGITVADDAALPAGQGPLAQVFGTDSHRFSVYKFYFYFLAKKPLAGGEPLVRGSDPAVDGYTYTLMRWASQPVLDYEEVRSWVVRVRAGATAPDLYLDEKLATLRQTYAGAVDLSVSDATAGLTPAGFYQLLRDGASDLSPATSRLTASDYRGAIHFGVQDGRALAMVAFNNGTALSPPAVPAVDLLQGGQLQTPRYALASEHRPFGFEVLIGGPVTGREALVRLALASRATGGGGKLAGLAVQQTVRLYAR
ncbi:MAG: hypothetical protein VKP62_07540 [Candidatus Sericytochromatia bacterium]|nr:hypothetical protein [Candidatus Sericytochromatia bacterium]